MGWGRYLLLGSLGQQLDLSDHENEIAKLRYELERRRSSSKDVTAQIENLEAENDEMRLYLATVLRLLAAKGVVSQEEIRQVVQAIDREDGVQDGRYSGGLGGKSKGT
ncbi:MAG TPA: hypothetical protein PLY86_15485 [bacterium]|nr:hypothetical protein [bacterium]